MCTVGQALESFKHEYRCLVEIGLRVFCISGVSSSRLVEGNDLALHIHEGLTNSDPLPREGTLHTMVPIIFDYRDTPSSYRGMIVEYGISYGGIDDREEDVVPEEFRDSYHLSLHWDEEFAPEKYERLVDRCPELIHERLRCKTRMSRADMLNALAFGDFDRHKRTCKALRERRHL